MKAARTLFAEFRTGQGLKGQLLRGGVGSVAVKIGSTLLSVALAVVLARALGAEGFGVYSFVFALITILAIPAQMGLPNLVVRETAKAQAENDWPLINGLWRWATLMALMMSAALIIIGALAAWIFAARLPEGGLAVFYWGLVLVPLIALGNLRGAALRGLRHVVQGQLPEFILRPAFLVVLVLGAHFGLSARALTASDAMMLHALASLAAFILGAFLLLRARPVEARAETRTATRPRAWLAAALPLGMVQGMQLVNQNVGLIALGIVASAEDVGLFRVALQGAVFVAFGLSVVGHVVGPHFAQLHANGERERLQKLVTISARANLLFAAPIALTFILFGGDILTVLFGEEFVGATLALAILTLGQLVKALCGSVEVLLIMAGHERDVLFGIGISAAANVLLTLALVPTFSIEGAAAAAAISLVVWHGVLYARVIQRMGLDSTSIGFAVRKKRAVK